MVIIDLFLQDLQVQNVTYGYFRLYIKITPVVQAQGVPLPESNTP